MHRITLPTYITLLRMLLIPFVILFFSVHTPSMRVVAALLFSIASLTDWLDGALARFLGQVSQLGEFLDPVADKILVGTTLFILASFQELSFISTVAALVILAREFMVTQLRSSYSTIKVSFLSKIKTSIQMISLILLLGGTSLGDYAPLLGTIFLCIAALMTLTTGYRYMACNLLPLLVEKQNQPND